LDLVYQVLKKHNLFKMAEDSTRCISEIVLFRQAEYVKKLRPFLPDEAFEPDPSKLLILFINLCILIFGWFITSYLNHWTPQFLWFYPFQLVIMANSITSLLFCCHEIIHRSIVRYSWLTNILILLGMTMLWMPPTQWKIIHNLVHHKVTNSIDDPDRNHLETDSNNWGKWIWQVLVPSIEIKPITLIFSMANAWIIHTFRNVSSVLLFNNKSVQYVISPFIVNPKERKKIFVEFLVILIIHFGILICLKFNWLKILLGYFMPMWLGHAGCMFYIYTNHMISPMTSINDPLINTVSLKMPKIFDLLHLNMSYHAEHHIFPGMNSDYYPLVRSLLQKHYPERMNYILDAKEAWHLLLTTPRLYKNEVTFTDSSGKMSVICPILNTSISIKKLDSK